MKFKVAVKDFSAGLTPAISVATKGVVKESPTAFLVMIVAQKDGILVLANGGRMGIKTHISDLHNCNDLKYKCEEEGSCAVRASELKATLESFNDEDEIWVEIRTYSENKDDADNSEDKLLAEVDDGKELVLTLVSDSEEYQTMQTYRDIIETPQFISDLMETKNSKNSLQVRRDIFVSAAKRVFFARGFENTRETYLYWVISAQPSEIRFATGSGARFAVLDLAGSDLTKGKDTFKILVPNTQTPAIIDVLESSNDEFIMFFPDDNYLLIKGNSFEAFVSNYESETRWPDVSIFLDKKSPCRFTSKITNWGNVVRGISATLNEEIRKQHDFHYAELDIDFKNENFIQTKTEGVMRSKRKVIVDDMDISSDIKPSGSISVSCVSKYLAEAVKNAVDNDDYVQMEISDNKTPVIIRYHASQAVDGGDFWSEINPSGIRERYTMFFAPRKVKD